LFRCSFANLSCAAMFFLERRGFLLQPFQTSHPLRSKIIAMSFLHGIVLTHTWMLLMLLILLISVEVFRLDKYNKCCSPEVHLRLYLTHSNFCFYILLVCKSLNLKGVHCFCFHNYSYENWRWIVLVLVNPVALQLLLINKNIFRWE